MSVCVVSVSCVVSAMCSPLWRNCLYMCYCHDSESERVPSAESGTVEQEGPGGGGGISADHRVPPRHGTGPFLDICHEIWHM